MALATACSSEPKPVVATVADVAGHDIVFGMPTDMANGKPDLGIANDVSAVDDALGGNEADGDATEVGTDSSATGACPSPGGSGCACQEGSECDIGLCLPTPEGQRCATPCTQTCSTGYKCAAVSAPNGDLVSVCVTRWGVLCNPCSQTSECATVLAKDALCVDRGAAGHFCGAACQDDGDCPSSDACQEATSVEGKTAKQCMPAIADGNVGECTCSTAAIGAQLQTSCHLDVKDASGQVIGVCKGVRFCDGSGLTACSASAAASETCNGEDDDCDGQTDEAACDDGSPCTQDVCDAKGQACNHLPSPGACDADSNACTVGDTCEEGKCTAGKVKFCDDGNPCTVDACNPASGCTSTLDDGAPCNDEDGCTLGDVCKAGACQPGINKVCGGGGACVLAACQASTGQCALTNAATATGCDDGSACTASDACAGSQCLGKAIECDDGNPCTLDGCAAAMGCTHAASTAPCDDGNACTDGDKCQGGACAGTVKDAKACDDGSVCTTDACDPIAGCGHGANVSVCDDGNLCTNGDACKDKLCVPGTNTCGCTVTADCAKEEDANLCNGVLFCDKSVLPYKCKVNPATVVVCDVTIDTACANNLCAAATGKCALKSQADGKACDADGSVCTIGDACKAGMCAAGAALLCDDKNACTSEACDAKVGCTQTANSAACDDGNACTVGDVCNAKLCAPGPTKVCNDGQDCTVDSCNSKTGACLNDGTAKNGQACDADGSICTGGDACSGGACVAGPQASCNDNNPCTTDSCDKAKGCVHATVADQTACGTGLWCIAAVCKKKPVCGDNILDPGEQCDDGNTVTGDGCSATCLVEKPPVPLPGELLITEFMADPANTQDEWVELYNATDKPLLLEGLLFGDAQAYVKLTKPGGWVMQPKTYVLIAALTKLGKTGPTPDFSYGYQQNFIQFSNSTDLVCVSTDTQCATGPIAKLTYSTSSNGWKKVTNAHTFSLNPAKLDQASMVQGANWCLGSTLFGTAGDFGTPGKANDSCP